MKSGIAYVFWTLFAAGIVLHFWIGGVVVETKVEDLQHFMMLRESPGEWMRVSSVTYWAQSLVEAAVLVFGALVVFWALWRWLWHGGFPKSR